MKTSFFSTETRCTCDARFVLPVGLVDETQPSRISACVSCGAIILSKSSASENDVKNPANPAEPTLLTPKTLAWLNRWPRLLVSGNGDFACLPAAVRCTTACELETVRSAAWNAQSHLPRGRRLNRAGWPMTPPPDCLPSSLSHYRILWEAAGFTPSTDLDTLLYWADPAHALVSPLALNALLQRRDLRQLLPGLAHSPVLRRRSVLCALAREDASLIPLLRAQLQSWLQRHDRAPDFPQKRVFSAEADVCRNSLRAWQLTRAIAPITTRVESRCARESSLSVAA